MAKLRTKRLGRQWWIVGDEEDGPYGPYDTKAEADDDRRGCQRFFDMKENQESSDVRSNMVGD